jgi:hypothetical protein
MDWSLLSENPVNHKKNFEYDAKHKFQHKLIFNKNLFHSIRYNNFFFVYVDDVLVKYTRHKLGNIFRSAVFNEMQRELMQNLNFLHL